MQLNLPTIENFIAELKERRLKTIYTTLLIEDIPTEEKDIALRRTKLIFQSLASKDLIIQYTENIGETLTNDEKKLKDLITSVESKKDELFKKLENEKFEIREGWFT